MHLLPRRQLQSHHQRPRQGQDDNVGKKIQGRVNVVHGVFIDTVGITVWPPIGSDRRTLKDGGEEEDNPPAENKCGDTVRHDTELAAGEKSIVEEKDGEFD